MMVMPRIFSLLLLCIHLKRIATWGCCSKLKSADESCLDASEYLLASVYRAPNISPCKDFFDYACGLRIQAWKSAAEYYAHVDKEQRHKRIDKMKSLLENNITTKNKAKSIKIVQKFFQGCLKYRFDSNKNLVSLLSDIKKYGGMPILAEKRHENWQNLCEKTDFTILLSRCHKLMGNSFQNLPFFHLVLNNMVKRNQKPMMMLLPMPNVAKYDNVNAIYEFMKSLTNPVVFQQGGNITEEEEKTKAMAIQIAQFIYRLSEITMWTESPPNLKGIDLFNNMRTIKLSELDEMLDFMDLEQYLYDLSKGNKLLFNESTEIAIPDLASVKELNTIISSTKCEVIINYIWYKTIQELRAKFEIFPLNDEEVKKKLNTIENEHYAKNGQCLKIMETTMVHASGALYVRNQKNANQIKASVEQIAKNIQAAMAEIISKTQVLVNQTKTVAHDKIQKILFRIGYPDMSFDNTQLDEHHKTLVFPLTANNYYDMVKAVHAWNVDTAFQDLHLDLDKQTWTITPAGDDASYNKVTNSITIPSAFLEHPYFWVETKDEDEVIRSMNYGVTGYTIGHEISHAFDINGRCYDGDGKIILWELESLIRYNKKLDRLEELFNNIIDPEHGTKLDGKKTLDENMADNSGLMVAYLAYKKFKTNRDSSRTTEVNNRLNGFPELTEDQVFFVSYAQMYCANYGKRVLELLVKTDTHSPRRHRVNPVLQNSEDFSKAFNCTPGIGMNPEIKFQIW